MTGRSWFHTHVGACDFCGKTRYTTKKKAKTDMKRLYPGENMQVYQCGDYWHYGHYTSRHTRADYRQMYPQD